MHDIFQHGKGGNVGLMGLVSQAVHRGGGYVLGSIPRTLMCKARTGSRYQTSVYNLDMAGKGANALDWARGPGNVDCSAIQPCQPCFEPDNVVSHASFAFNSYYQQNGATDIACSFGGTGIKVNENPSYDNCLYMTTGSNKTAASNATTLASTTTSSAANGSFAWTTSCLIMALLSFL
ncbi:Glucan endo-1,3-beta-glucosidase 13 [Vitis vinifera]|uniref:Glucan endo-1,3-beta-glucosidase 13 n=1 Tax=Vitis vinifera TaxID=29760 RepID=A0A438C714_VITVI|nr:Glucan endo-1,3-beta-glucosidase 13 [Vitis vinifera]